MQTTMTTTEAIRDSTTILRWVVWSAVRSDALLMATLRPLDGWDKLRVNVAPFQIGGPVGWTHNNNIRPPTVF